MADTLDVVEHLSYLLDSGNYKEVLNLPNDDKCAKSLKDNCWDLISIIISKIKDDTIVLKPSLHGVCEEFLNIIVEKASPEETLLVFIENIEEAKNDAQFSIILNPLQQLLKKLTNKRERSLEWCLNSISTYVETIQITEHQLEDKERLLMDCDPNIRRVAKVYSFIPPFYNPFIKELESSCNNNTKQIIEAFLISLLGKPLIYIDMDPDSNATGEVRQICSTIIKDICRLEKNVYKFFPYLEICNRESQTTKKKFDVGNDNESPFNNRDKVNMTTLSGFLYAVFSGHFEVADTALPQVYSIEYTIQAIMQCVIHLLNFPEYGPLVKAISLSNSITNRLPSNSSHKLLLSSVYYDFCKGLITNSIYSSYDTVRKGAVKSLGIFINKFDYRGRCMLCKYIIEASNHSGMIGYAITQYKNSLNEAFVEDTLPECFIGPQLMTMIKKFCYLPHGAESDLVELADQIISALNLLRYLAIKDMDNKTGVRDNFTFIETEYLDKLRMGLNMSKAHYEVKLKDLEQGKTLIDQQNVSVNVGGNTLDKIPPENKKEIIHSALNAFHLIEGLVARLSECINSNKS